MHVKKNDIVVILAGKDKGKTGKILRSLPKENQVIVEGVHLRKKHQKATKSGEKGKVVERNFPIHVSNVKLASKDKKEKKTKKASAK